MDSWIKILERMRAHTPLTPQQANDEIAAAERKHKEAVSFLTSRMWLNRAGTFVGVGLLIAGYMTFGAWWAWILLGAGFLLATGCFIFASEFKERIESEDITLRSRRHDYLPLSASQTRKIASLAERSTEFAKIVEGWLEARSELTGHEYDQLYGAEEALERYLAEQRILASAKRPADAEEQLS